MDVATLPVSRVMRAEFVSVGEKDQLDYVDQVMALGHVRHMPVLDEGGHLVGIVSNRDLLEAALTDVLEFDSKHRRTFLRSVDVSEVMSRTVQTAAPDTPLAAAAARMVEHKIGCLPVVDTGGSVVGLVTETDLLAAAYLEGSVEDPDDTGSAG